MNLVERTEAMGGMLDRVCLGDAEGVKVGGVVGDAVGGAEVGEFVSIEGGEVDDGIGDRVGLGIEVVWLKFVAMSIR